MDIPDRPGHCSRRKEVERELVTRPPEHGQTRQTMSLFQKKRSGERAGYSATRTRTHQTDQITVPEEKKWRESWLLGNQSMDRPDRPGHCSRRKELVKELVIRPPEHGQTRQTRSLFQKKRSGERPSYSATRAWTDQTDQVTVPEEKKWRERAGYSATRAWTYQTDHVTVPEEKKWRESWLLGHQNMDRPGRPGQCSRRKEVEREVVTRPPEKGQTRQTRSLF